MVSNVLIFVIVCVGWLVMISRWICCVGVRVVVGLDGLSSVCVSGVRLFLGLVGVLAVVGYVSGFV